MQVSLDNKIYNVEIIKKRNRNTYIRVKQGIIYVTTNYLCTKKEIEKLILNNQKSIIKMIEHDNKKQEKEENFYYFGNKYDVIYGFSKLEFDEDKIYVKDKKELENYLKKDIYNVFKQRLDYWYNIYEEKIPVPNLKIRKMTTRWGVCNIKNHNVTLNYHLSKYDISCLDYVIVHELSHFIYPNHSSSFWLQVSKYYPNYKECRKKLKD